MNKVTKVAGITLALFAFAGVASAASITNIEFSNGDTTYQGKGGSTVNAEFRVVVPAGEVVEQFEIDVMGDSLAPRCEEVGGSKGLEEGTHFVKRSIKLPPNTGEYDVNVRTAGNYGGTRSIDCDDNTNGSDSFSDAVRVASSGSSSNDDDDFGSDKPSWLDAFLAAITALVKPVDTKPAYCATYAGASAGGTYALQMWLVQNGFMSQEAMNTGPGIYGPKTTSANLAAAAKCN